MLIAYSKWDEATSEHLLVVVNMDPKRTQTGWVTVDEGLTDIPAGTPYVVRDLLDDAEYRWTGLKNYVSLNPLERPAHIFRIVAAANATGGAGRE